MKSGLSNSEANKRLIENGLNVATDVKKKGVFYFLFQSFKDKFILILLVLAVIDYITSDVLGTIIILVLAVASALLRFFQDYSTYKFNEKLKARIRPKTDVIRKNKDENEALILQLKSNNQAKEVEKQELKEILKNMGKKK